MFVNLKTVLTLLENQELVKINRELYRVKVSEGSGKLWQPKGAVLRSLKKYYPKNEKGRKKALTYSLDSYSNRKFFIKNNVLIMSYNWGYAYELGFDILELCL